MLRLLLLLLTLALPARGDEILADLGEGTVALNATFAGTEVLVFGAIRRTAADPTDADPLDVIVTIQGPNTPVTVWRKARRGGIWVNVEGVRVSRAPDFYAVASTAPLDVALSATDDLRHRISIPLAVRAIGGTQAAADAPNFTEALIRLRREAGLYQQIDGGVRLEGGTLFSARIDLPASLPDGTFAVRVFLLRAGQVVDVHETTLDVGKVGLERMLYTLAHEQPLLYGLLALLLAVTAGWGASELFQRMRR